MAHVFEVLSIVEDIQTNPSLRTAMEQCDASTQAYFKAVAAFLGTDHHKMLLRIRNNAAFHYDSKLAVTALDQIANDSPASGLSTHSALIRWTGSLNSVIWSVTGLLFVISSSTEGCRCSCRNRPNSCAASQNGRRFL
jgi:hypothetical protein